MKFLLAAMVLLFSTVVIADQFDINLMESMVQRLIVAKRIIGYDKDGVDILGRRACPNDWKEGMPLAGCKAGTTIVAFYGQALDNTNHFDGDGNLGRSAQSSVILKEDATPIARGGSYCLDTSSYGSGNPEHGFCIGPDKALSFTEVIGQPKIEDKQDYVMYFKDDAIYFMNKKGRKYKVYLSPVR